MCVPDSPVATRLYRDRFRSMRPPACAKTFYFSRLQRDRAGVDRQEPKSQWRRPRFRVRRHSLVRHFDSIGRQRDITGT
jgi:hypothetical protein